MFDSIAPRWDSFRGEDSFKPFEVALAASTGRCATRSISARAPARARSGSSSASRKRTSSAPTSPRRCSSARGRRSRPRASSGRTPRDLPFADESFDLVTHANMIPFFDELARVVRPGRLGSVRLLGRGRDADLRAARTPARRARAPRFRRLCGLRRRQREVSARAEALGSMAQRRSRRGSTGPDVSLLCAEQVARRGVAVADCPPPARDDVLAEFERRRMRIAGVAAMTAVSRSERLAAPRLKRCCWSSRRTGSPFARHSASEASLPRRRPV